MYSALTSNWIVKVMIEIEAIGVVVIFVCSTVCNLATIRYFTYNLYVRLCYVKNNGCSAKTCLFVSS